MTFPDLTEALQARLRANLEADRNSLCKLPDSGESSRIEALEAKIATLQDAIANTEALGEQQRQEAGTAVRRLEASDAEIATLKEVVAKAQALAEERRREAETAVKRVEVLEAHFAQIAIGIKLAIMMGEGYISGFDAKRLQRIAESVGGIRTTS